MEENKLNARAAGMPKRKVLHVNKTKFVRLLRSYWYQPTVRRSLLDRAPRKRSWFLFWGEAGKRYMANLTTNPYGMPILIVFDANTGNRSTYYPDLSTLRNYGMTKEL